MQFYTKCAVLNPFVQFLNHKCAVTKLTKIALIKTVFSFTRYPCGCSRKFQQQLSLIERFLGEDSRPSYFPHKTLMFWGNGKEGEIGASEAPQKRLEWENLIFFAVSNANLRLLYILNIHDSQYMF